MVVFIDDLDRCSPGKVAAVVEAINLFLAGEFPDCMFVLGIDDEMVSAALDHAHSDVIVKLPGYAKATSIGWRFMDKFVQLPFIIPPSDTKELAKYVDSLFFSQDGEVSEVDIQTRDRVARVIERRENRPSSPEQIVQQVTSQQPLSPGDQHALEKDAAMIQEMDKNIRMFNDQEKAMRDFLLSSTQEFFSNPRDLKRFVNLFRFYYFIRTARQSAQQPVSSIEQMCRWLMFSLKWPEVVRWLRHYPAVPGAATNSYLATLEHLGETCSSLEEWQAKAGSDLRLKVEQTPWLGDEALMKFFQSEATQFHSQDRLSSCVGTGLW
jgi:predicted KAP-like P-loop ATPase